ncbi:Allophanate hydrolase 2 subunit 1 (EC 3.5.1.54) [uncultured Gammaproteobacteria bacterium]|uniref:5-oxoprolinase subunit PxpB n=1 Tax=Bathymodiolus heckerae thiotrophic gill symbiont TaxID=1052212 RepID=UPI0010B61252|nr:5-oxoprolinase subunit PxpB [Bathymodiolus heckerae thiotrophic gill symbiont]CAC9594936.1 Allophanate hydrolase 2 subunit 1 (EC 3.5.1.54) [uncultured Gammaproteobacteria bacterium]SHN90425.1 Allophanate hydrolase 2 subunit 1 [Bathymodiolus heckerae thiotrophic gill symbiont]
MHKIILAGEDSILIYFGSKIDSALPKNIANFANALKAEFSQLIIDLTPSYTSLLVHYDLSKVNYLTFSAEVQNLLTNFEFSNTTEDSNLIYIPVYYGFESGLDLERLLAEKNLNLDEFIKIHSDKEYLVYAIGFSPVFTFLGEVDIRIQAPRLATPRIKIPAGSVGIADSQTAVYPTDSSGGWNIIGRTVQDLSLKNPDNLNKFKTGDRVKFYSITREEFIEHGGQL